MQDLNSIVRQALSDAESAADLAALDQVRVRVLGKSGAITEQLKGLGKLPAAERPAAGQKINEAKEALTKAIELRRGQLEQGKVAAALAAGRVDITLPGRGTAI